jgi:hypothetical protein
MKAYTWEEQRKDIQSEINKFFGRAIQITPRAMAALQSGDNNEEEEHYPGVYEISILESLLRSSPGCAVALLKAGAKLEDFPFYGNREEPAPLASATLEWIFSGVDTHWKTETGRKVKSRGILDESDILISSLEASLNGKEPNSFGSSILKAANSPSPKKVDTDSLV